RTSPTEIYTLSLHDALPICHDNARWVWRCHIDTSEPYQATWAFLQPFLQGYDAAVFTLADFVPPGLPIGRVDIIQPAIDPESPKDRKSTRLNSSHVAISYAV